MTVYTLFTAGPLVWLAMTSLKSHREIVRGILAWPKEASFDNFVRAWQLGDFGTAFVNSVVYALVSTVVTLVLALALGYAFSHIRSRFTPFLYSFVLLGLLITVHSTLIPLFVLENAVGINNTRFGILLPYIAFGLPFAVYLATVFIRDIPKDIIAAAQIDGANHWQIFRYIILPVSLPISATIAIFTFLAAWNEFVLVFTLTSGRDLQSLQVGINALVGGRNADQGVKFAALVIGTLPMLVFYLLFQNQLRKGFVGGAIKG